MSYTAACLCCGRALASQEYGRPRHYCTDACRKRHQRRSLTDRARAETHRALLEQWAHEFWGYGLQTHLRGILTDYGEDAAQRAAAAVRVAILEQNANGLRAVLGTNITPQARQFAALLERRDPRVAKFLEECGL
ncbi:MAG: hypothetical protein WCJ55_19575 [Chloroflexales bacterium]